MDIETLRQWIAERDSISILETVDVHTGVRTVLQEFDYVIEAPNRAKDGRCRVWPGRDSDDQYVGGPVRRAQSSVGGNSRGYLLPDGRISRRVLHLGPGAKERDEFFITPIGDKVTCQ